jgi:hypothetical protein
MIYLMKYSILSLSIFVIFFTIVRADIEIAKGQCEDLGFKPGTEKYADCVMKLLPKKDTKKKQLNTDKATSKIDKNTKKVGEDNSNLLKFDEATYVGEVKKGKAYGIGVITFSDGSKYEGKVSNNRIHGKGIYTDSQGNVFEGKFRRGKFKNKIDKKTRKIINLDVNKGISSNFEIKGKGRTSGKWFEAEKTSSGTYELTAKGKRDMEAGMEGEGSEGGGDGGGGGGGGCG